jgi:parallel beta-helix repeat protein
MRFRKKELKRRKKNMKRKSTRAITTTLLIAVFLISAMTVIAPMPTTKAQKELQVYGYGNTLHVADGATQWAEISIPVDIPLSEISELTFWQMIKSYGASGWDVNVILGIDANNDGAFTADVAGWHIGSNAWTLTALNGDTFIEMDGPAKDPTTNVWKEINALTTAQWWTPDQSGAGFAKSDTYPWTFYGTFADLINVFIPDSTQTSLIPDASVHVKVIMLVIGGSGSWVDETAYLGSLTINGETYYLTIQKAIDDAVEGDTILVNPRTYAGDIMIDKALTVRSTDGAEETIIDGTGSYIVTIRHSDVTFEGFTVTNPDYEGGADASGILVEAIGVKSISNVHILNNIVTQVRSETGTPSMYGATGINIGTGPISNVTVSGNTIKNITNPDGASVDHTCGINVWDGADNVVISNNTISDIKYNGIILEYASNVRIEENSITGCPVGIRVEPYEGVTVSGLTINHNDIAGNREYGVFNTMDATIDATLNWWGDPSGPYHATANPGGLGDAVSDNVDFSPWLLQSYPPPPPQVPTWPPEPYREPINVTEVRGNAETILSTLGDAIITGKNATEVGELDYNHDGATNIADAFDQFRDVGLLRRPSWSFDPDAASEHLAVLESVYGANLENFPSVEGRVWLLYMLEYLPSS